MEIVPVPTPTAQRNLVRCDSEKLCGLCKQPLGRSRVFVLDLPATILRLTAQAPMHQRCALTIVESDASKDILLSAWSVKDYEKVRDAKGILYLRPSLRDVRVDWWLNNAAAVANDVFAGLHSNALERVLLKAEEFDGITRTRICADAYSMLEMIETKILPRI